MMINYRIEGNPDGPNLVLAHGMGVTFSIWKNLAPLLCPYYRLILVELPGNGQTPPPQDDIPYYTACAISLEELREYLRIPSWDMLGYSMGTWVVHAYQSCWPSRVNRVALVCPGYITPYWSAGLYALDVIDQHMPWATSWMLKSWRLDWVVRLLGFNGKNNEYSELWSREIGSQPIYITKRQLRDLPRPKSAPHADNPERMRIIWGLNDPVSCRPRRPGACDRFVPGCHSAPMLFPREIAAELVSFFSWES